MRKTHCLQTHFSARRMVKCENNNEATGQFAGLSKVAAELIASQELFSVAAENITSQFIMLFLALVIHAKNSQLSR